MAKKENKEVNVKTESVLLEEDDLQLAKQMFKYAEKGLENFVDSMVHRAERFADELNRQRGYFNEKKDEVKTANQGLMSRADCFRSMLGTVRNCFYNYDFQDASRYVSNYEKAKAILAVLEGKKVW